MSIDLDQARRRFQMLLDEWNLKFFGGRLFGWRVLTVDDGKARWQGQCDPDNKVITLNLHKAAPGELEAVLLHELAHAASGDGHGGRWRHVLQELQRRGAPTGRIEDHVQRD